MVLSINRGVLGVVVWVRRLVAVRTSGGVGVVAVPRGVVLGAVGGIALAVLHAVRAADGPLRRRAGIRVVVRLQCLHRLDAVLGNGDWRSVTLLRYLPIDYMISSIQIMFLKPEDALYVRLVEMK